jgi:hypothetical protein
MVPAYEAVFKSFRGVPFVNLTLKTLLGTNTLIEASGILTATGLLKCCEAQSGIAGRCVLIACYLEVTTRSLLVATMSPRTANY